MRDTILDRFDYYTSIYAEYVPMRASSVCWFSLLFDARLYFNFHHYTAVGLQAINHLLATYALAIYNWLFFALANGMKAIIGDA